MRLIDADRIMDCLLDEGQNNGEKYGIKWGRKIIFTPYEVAKIVARAVPTVDAVPVVRCKDCKHWKHLTYLIVNDTERPFGQCDKWGYEMSYYKDYCNRAERKADTTDDTTPSFMSEWAREIEEQLNNLKIKKENKQ